MLAQIKNKLFKFMIIIFFIKLMIISLSFNYMSDQ